jgi:hypothetical protein
MALAILGSTILEISFSNQSTATHPNQSPTAANQNVALLMKRQRTAVYRPIEPAL